MACLFFLVTYMTAELAGGCELTELVTYHVFSNINRDEFVSVVNCNGMTHEVGRYH